MIHDFIVGYMCARSNEAREMYARYLSYLDPYLFEEIK
jgi:hypothetical protein